ncbi:MAG: spore cortex-lytic enzyme [Clostridiales bacterium]|nr:spore cortex-lytic enzyme [Eubacteriales bacterium]MDH7566535.1 spore cortex-lytic enzyme [Clostridiales bacterium]
MLVYKSEIADLYGFSRAALSYYGSQGQEVINIQAKLYNWGYYKGIVDGIYGYETYKAVKLFQYKNGLTVDGIAGPETLAALGLPTGTQASYSTSASVDKDTNLLAHLIYGEARGEPYVGQVAVGGVIMNRTRDSRFPKTIAGVIYQPGAFDAVSDGQINLEPDSTAYKAARDAINGWDPSGGAIYYFNPATATSKWIWSRTIITVIGKHYFAK